MRILVNDIAASTGGALSILKSFYEFAKLDQKNEYVFLLSDNHIEAVDNIKVIVIPDKKKWLERLKFDLFIGKNYIKNFKVDVIISLQNTIIFGTKIKQIVYVHQAIPFQNIKKFSFIKKKERKLAIIQYGIGFLIKLSIKKANNVIVQAKWMKDAICKKVKTNEDKIIIVQPDISNIPNLKLDNNLNTNCFFYPANEAVYKNHQCIYRACDILNRKGIKNYRVELTINDKINKERIITIGQLSHKKVLEKYKNMVLLFPSYIETVGLPLLEAKASGTIILASDCLFSRDILKNYENAYFFNPFNASELATLMEKCISKNIKLKKINLEYKEKINTWENVMKIITESK